MVVTGQILGRWIRAVRFVSVYNVPLVFVISRRALATTGQLRIRPQTERTAVGLLVYTFAGNPSHCGLKISTSPTRL
jgi:hypothetical protein